MPWAHNDRISTAPIDGGIKITEEQYAEALAGILEGKTVSIDDGFKVEFPPEPEPIEQPPVSPFWPVEPAAFWEAVYDLFGLKDTDVLSAITDPEEHYKATNALNRRKTYRRDDPMFIQLATLKGYTNAEEVDALWIYIQENYV